LIPQRIGQSLLHGSVLSWRFLHRCLSSQSLIVALDKLAKFGAFIQRSRLHAPNIPRGFLAGAFGRRK
jgi:hypothetical protein